MALLRAVFLLVAIALSDAHSSDGLRGRSNSPSSRRLEENSVPTANRAPLPPFSVQFTSLITSDADLDRIRAPLKLIAEEFLVESFQIALGRPTTDPGLLWFRQNFVSLRLVISHTSSEPVRSSSKQSITTLFEGQVLYRNGMFNSEYKLSDEQLTDVCESILRQTFVDDRQVLQQYLEKSIDPVLQKHTLLSLRVGDQALGLVNMRKRAQNPVLLTVILLVGLVGAVPLMFLAKRSQLHVVIKEKWNERYKNSDLPTVLAGRKADDDDDGTSSHASVMATKVLEASDQYLSRHRPDLLDKTPTKSLSAESTATSPTSTMSPSSPASSLHLLSVSGWLKQTLLRRRALRFGGDGLVRDDEAANYKFAFQDWSRKDGTPIYKYAGGGGKAEHYPVNGDFASSSVYSDDLFRRNLQATFDNEYCNVDDNHEFSQEQAEAFMDRLEALYDMKHSHYQKDRMLNDTKFRMQVEARNRDMQLRRHEMELDLEAIEAPYTQPRLQQPVSRQPDVVDNSFGRAPLFGRPTGKSGVKPTFKTIAGAIGIPRSNSKSNRCPSDAAPTAPGRMSLARSSSHGELSTLASQLPPLGSGKKTVSTGDADGSRGRTAVPQRRSRRSHSHGINERRRRAQGERADNVMTFGIAAYLT